MPAPLVAYIAHPSVRAWLDCMVWSSAQAHNVREMVDRVFGAGEGAGSGPILRAVWARDTLGLGREAFYQKTQTTKDLAKPWAFFNAPKTETYSPTHGGGSNDCVGRVSPGPGYLPSSSPRRSSPPPSPPPTSSQPPPSSSWSAQPDSGWGNSTPSEPAIAVDTNLAPKPESASVPSAYPHGPETTLLVDDSPLKARLQPWNHLCVGEYDAVTRTRDRAAACLPPDPPPSNDAPSGPHANGSGDAGPPRGKYRKALDAELAGLAEEDAAAGGVEDTNDRPANAVVRKERWRKRRRAEEATKAQAQVQAQEEAADGTGTVAVAEDSAGAAEGSNVSTHIARDDEPGPTVPNQSKRSRRRERKRQKQADTLGEGSSGNAAVPANDQLAAEVADEPASGSGGSDASPSLSPSPTRAVVENDTVIVLSNDSNRLPDPDGIPEKSGIATNADASVELSAPTSSPDGGSKKRKRQSDVEEVEENSPETKPEDTVAPPECTDGEPYDPTLLAVIGVLSHVRSVGNVAAWVRSGGLLAAIEEGADGPEAKDDVIPQNGPTGADAPKVESSLPSDPAQWFASRPLLVAWAARGRAALAELGIDAAPGVE
ncbi:FCP1-like proteiny domain-containing protein [Mycena venus]|uniref:FCP1-like proteiny domain-containing protein n=1 Tax=Mycena venus TaxID=2733690 RepID=A0A8H6X9A1_9AGAR|nr:FCP1-like proteiny domain-containing protein [Mycena venus]